MISTEHINGLINGGGNVVGTDGAKIGGIGQIYVDDQTGEPNWVTVKTGLFGTSESFVPLDNATNQGNDIAVPYSKDKVKDAPRVAPDGHLSREEEDELYRYYEIGGTTAGYAETSGTAGYSDTTTTGTADYAETSGTAGYADTSRGTVGHDTSGPTTDDAMTRSEERLHVGTEKQETGRARLRKYIVTEDVTTTVPVSREEVRIEREPITDANRGDALSGPDLSEEEHEVILSEERPVVAKETVPVERVRLDKETVTEEQTVTEQVRKEQIDTTGADGNGVEGTGSAGRTGR
ncbi:MAG: hypothetical protein JWO93_714 [Micrococcaceae bacterium]|nr:hypothetical protein [Micrococcaceae bacterium]